VADRDWRETTRFIASVVNSLAIPLLTVAATAVGIYATNTLKEREIEIATENNAQALRNQREESETNLRSAMFREEYQQMVIVKDIELYSMCEHHMLPFFGKAHVAYIPNGHIVGLSKIPRVVDAFARRLQVQERLTVDIRNCIDETLKPLGVAVVIEAQHLCMIMRGIQKQHSVATTSAFTGEFNAEKTRAEFMRLITRAGS